MAYYIALYLARAPEARHMEPKQLQEALRSTFTVSSAALLLAGALQQGCNSQWARHSQHISCVLQYACTLCSLQIEWLQTVDCG
jgi:hypothetical protein